MEKTKCIFKSTLNVNEMCFKLNWNVNENFI